MDGALREENIRLSRRCQNGVFILGLCTLLLMALFPTYGPSDVRAAFLLGFYALVMLGGPLAVTLLVAAFAYARGFALHELSRRLALCFIVTLVIVLASVVAWYDVLILR